MSVESRRGDRDKGTEMGERRRRERGGGAMKAFLIIEVERGMIPDSEETT